MTIFRRQGKSSVKYQSARGCLIFLIRLEVNHEAIPKTGSISSEDTENERARSRTFPEATTSLMFVFISCFSVFSFSRLELGARRVQSSLPRLVFQLPGRSLFPMGYALLARSLFSKAFFEVAAAIVTVLVMDALLLSFSRDVIHWLAWQRVAS